MLVGKYIPFSKVIYLFIWCLCLGAPISLLIWNEVPTMMRVRFLNIGF